MRKIEQAKIIPLLLVALAAGCSESDVEDGLLSEEMGDADELLDSSGEDGLDESSSGEEMATDTEEGGQYEDEDLLGFVSENSQEALNGEDWCMYISKDAYHWGCINLDGNPFGGYKEVSIREGDTISAFHYTWRSDAYNNTVVCPLNDSLSTFIVCD